MATWVKVGGSEVENLFSLLKTNNIQFKGKLVKVEDAIWLVIEEYIP